MKEKFIKIFAIGSLTISLLYGVYAYGCAGGWWDARFVSIFSPEITVNNQSYEPFFFDDYTYFYNANSIQSTTELFKDETIADWTEYLEIYDQKTVEYYLYDRDLANLLVDITGKEDLIKAFNKYIETQYQLNFDHEKTNNFLTFIMMSRGIETYSNQTYNYWDYNNRISHNADQDFVDKKEQLYNKTSKEDAFYNNRIWFQVMRAKFYSTDRGSAIAFFEKTVKNQPKNSLYYRALSYVAGAYKSLGNYEKSNALFAQIFDEFEPLMPSSLFDYKPLEEQIFLQSLTEAPGTATQEAMYALQGYYTNSFEKMQQLYAINPQSRHLDFLLSRWVNINEQHINIYNTYENINIIDVEKVKSELKSKVNLTQFAWVNRVANEKKTNNPYLWKSAAAYFNSFVGDYQQSTHQLQEAFRLAENQLQKAQVRNLQLFNNLLSTNEININTKGKLIEDINWLFYDNDNVNYWESPTRILYLQTFTKKYLSALYQSQGNDLMAELIYPTKGFYKQKTNSEAMENLLLSDKRSAWQDVFIGLYPYKLADIYESRGIYLFYEDKIDEAIAEFEKIQPFERREYNWKTREYEMVSVDYKTLELPGNPFNGKIKDCNDCDHRAKQSVKYSQLSFLKKVKEMQEKIKAGDDIYNNAWLVGNAFYNASYFGNARAFYYNHIIDEYGNHISHEHKLMLYGMENVRKYYSLSQQAAQSDEEKAKMAYMFAKVERNDFYTNSYYMPNDYFFPYGDFVSFKKWDGFVSLKEEYSNTKYYQEVINECGYFRKYLGIE